MKKLFTLVLMLLFVSVASADIKMVRLTRYQNMDIKGVNVSNAFKVELHYSTDTYAQVEVPAELENRLIFDLDKNGNVVVGLVNYRGNDRYINNLQNMCVAKIYLNKLGNLKVSGAVNLKSYGEFVTDNFYGEISGATNVSDVVVKATETMKIIFSGASRMSATLGSDNVSMGFSGSSRADIVLNAGSAAFNGSGASHVNVSGNVDNVVVDISGACSFSGENLTAKSAKLVSAGASNIKVNVTDHIEADASGASSIRYTGSPVNINVKSSTASTVKKL